MCIKNIVINRNGTFYKFEQTIISLTALVSCYVYMYMACFGREAMGLQIYFVIESLFALDMLLTFFVEVQVDGKMEREINLITVNYIKTTFLVDLLPLVPFELILVHMNNSKLFFLLKLIRIRKGYGFLSVQKIISEVKKYHQLKG